MKTNRKDTSLTYKIVNVISIVSSITVLTLAILQIFDIWTQAANLYVPMLGVVMLCKAYTEWHKDRKIAYISLGVAAFVFACTIAIFILK